MSPQIANRTDALDLLDAILKIEGGAVCALYDAVDRWII